MDIYVNIINAAHVTSDVFHSEGLGGLLKQAALAWTLVLAS